MKSLKLFSIGLLAFFISSNVLAHSDVEITLQNNRIVVDPDNEAVLFGIHKLFEAEFGELGNPYGTDDPGLDVFGLHPNSLFWYKVEGTLKKWDVNSSSWLSFGFDEQISITKHDHTNIVSAVEGIAGQGLIGSVNSSGGLHTHLDFQISKAGGGNPDDGAYLLELSLFDTTNDEIPVPISAASDKFYLAFHLNEAGTFGHDAFDQAIGGSPHHDEGTLVEKSVMLGNLTGNVRGGEITRLRGDVLRQAYRCVDGCGLESPVLEPVAMAKDRLNLRRARRLQTEDVSVSGAVDAIINNFTNHTLLCSAPMKAEGNRCVPSSHDHDDHDDHATKVVVLQGGNTIEELEKEITGWERNRQRENFFYVIEYEYNSDGFVTHRVEYVAAWREGGSRYYENRKLDSKGFSIIELSDRQIAVSINASDEVREENDHDHDHDHDH
ncbi:hypothetical protein [Methylotuvimicrobium alcaliphilum]|uniref:Uncharacterized protein n=1 Tax=Methylotuvimicrobium alcaliphilum (strain DSM 19304 / NCIMB 14124 / VKM B-2133 / 20Z) TaxID=1091494 RepID=G4T203_META2|nr:hypothetical protein [Methylotuvimicrobium alcaliphilum]CCE24677.1 exported protein of unknown function [Methylotuvimicrobium alcaliphilum 20Z]